MSEYESKNIVNVSLVGQTATGKTSLAESILYTAKKVHKRGNIADGSTASDYRDYEISNNHSVSLTLLNFEYNSKKFNLIDTPGNFDFMGDLECATKVCDVNTIVVNPSGEVDLGTEIAFDASKKYNSASIFVVNLLDRDQADFEQTLSGLRSRFGIGVIPFTVPIDKGENFSQIASVLDKKIFKYSTDGNGTVSEVEPDDTWKSQLNKYYDELVELIAGTDEALMESYFENGELSENQLIDGIKKSMVENNIFPVFCVSGEKNIGVKTLMDLLSQYMPTSDLFLEDGDNTSMLVFKTINEEHIGELSFFKVCSGELKSGEDYSNSQTGQTEKLRQIYFLNGQERKDAGKIIAGDFGTALKLKDTHTGNTLSNSKDNLVISPMELPRANTSLSVFSKNRGDEEKVANGLALAHSEDPTFAYNVEPELKQTIVSGQGELQIKIALERIEQRFGVQLGKEYPKVPFRETITSNAESKYRHKKQSGGAGQFAEVWLRIRPHSRGEGIDFQQSLSGQNVDRGFVPSVEKGINSTCVDGVIAGCKVVDVKIDFYDGKMHPVDSNDMAFQIAGRHAFVEAFKNARPKLLEPIYKIKVKVHDSVIGDVMGDVSQRRGKVSGVDAEGAFKVVNAEVPLANLHDYNTALKSMTSGMGIFSQEFSHYEDMPHNEAEKVISSYAESKQKGE